MTTQEEQSVLDHLVTAWNEYLQLDVQHPNERDEFLRAMNQCQNLIAIRVARRADPATWPMHRV
jgi:hypothetical protein